jgi:hypothetical protein
MLGINGRDPVLLKCMLKCRLTLTPLLFVPWKFPVDDAEKSY